MNQWKSWDWWRLQRTRWTNSDAPEIRDGKRSDDHPGPSALGTSSSQKKKSQVETPSYRGTHVLGDTQSSFRTTVAGRGHTSLVACGE